MPFAIRHILDEGIHDGTSGHKMFMRGQPGCCAALRAASMKILIADDEPDVRSTLKMLLETRGHSVNTAENGREAVDAAVESPPDVILMDIRMPVMDGITATRLLRAHPETQAVPVICVSAYLAEGQSVEDAFKAGCFACLPKPLEWRKFEELLAQLQKQGPHRQDFSHK
jgi:CheY-like chemotaxis protein